MPPSSSAKAEWTLVLALKLDCTWQDDDPYVRKTAAVCVAKLHDINGELVEDRGFLETLQVGAASWPLAPSMPRSSGAAVLAATDHGAG